MKGNGDSLSACYDRYSTRCCYISGYSDLNLFSESNEITLQLFVKSKILHNILKHGLHKRQYQTNSINWDTDCIRSFSAED